jgi:hypothetical protein
MWLKDLVSKCASDVRVMVFDYNCASAVPGNLLSPEGLKKFARILVEALFTVYANDKH